MDQAVGPRPRHKRTTALRLMLYAQPLPHHSCCGNQQPRFAGLPLQLAELRSTLASVKYDAATKTLDLGAASLVASKVVAGQLAANKVRAPCWGRLRGS